MTRNSDLATLSGLYVVSEDLDLGFHALVTGALPAKSAPYRNDFNGLGGPTQRLDYSVRIQCWGQSWSLS